MEVEETMQQVLLAAWEGKLRVRLAAASFDASTPVPGVDMAALDRGIRECVDGAACRADRRLPALLVAVARVLDAHRISSAEVTAVCAREVPECRQIYAEQQEGLRVNKTLLTFTDAIYAVLTVLQVGEDHLECVPPGTPSDNKYLLPSANNRMFRMLYILCDLAKGTSSSFEAMVTAELRTWWAEGIPRFGKKLASVRAAIRIKRPVEASRRPATPPAVPPTAVAHASPTFAELVPSAGMELAFPAFPPDTPQGKRRRIDDGLLDDTLAMLSHEISHAPSERSCRVEASLAPTVTVRWGTKVMLRSITRAAAVNVCPPRHAPELCAPETKLSGVVYATNGGCLIVKQAVGSAPQGEYTAYQLHGVGPTDPEPAAALVKGINCVRVTQGTSSNGMVTRHGIPQAEHIKRLADASVLFDDGARIIYVEPTGLGAGYVRTITPHLEDQLLLQVETNELPYAAADVLVSLTPYNGASYVRATAQRPTGGVAHQVWLTKSGLVTFSPPENELVASHNARAPPYIPPGLFDGATAVVTFNEGMFVATDGTVLVRFQCRVRGSDNGRVVHAAPATAGGEARYPDERFAKQSTMRQAMDDVQWISEQASRQLAIRQQRYAQCWRRRVTCAPRTAKALFTHTTVTVSPPRAHCALGAAVGNLAAACTLVFQNTDTPGITRTYYSTVQVPYEDVAAAALIMAPLRTTGEHGEQHPDRAEVYLALLGGQRELQPIMVVDVDLSQAVELSPTECPRRIEYTVPAGTVTEFIGRGAKAFQSARFGSSDHWQHHADIPYAAATASLNSVKFVVLNGRGTAGFYHATKPGITGGAMHPRTGLPSSTEQLYTLVLVVTDTEQNVGVLSCAISPFRRP